MEMLTDLANEIAMSNYHPSMGTSPMVRPEHTVVNKSVPEAEPIADAIAPAFEVDTTGEGVRDCFIDDVIDCHLGTEQNLA
ncbi:MAG: hypothetical protein ACKPE6_16685, partial [Gammaproteobacteria bacterium]